MIKSTNSYHGSGASTATSRQKKAGRRLLLLCMIVATAALPAAAAADEDGRYRAIVLHEGGASAQSAALSPKVFILDSRDGHMWTWEQNARMKGPKGDLRFGTTTIYQGRLKVGSHMGEVVEQNR